MELEFIIIHHSLTKDSETVSWNAIKKFHIETNGWSDIGYHFGVELIGDQYDVLAGRGLDKTGAHCRQAGMNHKSIGICLVGNFDNAPPPEAAWEKLLSYTRSLMYTFDIPKEKVIGHREAGLMDGLDWKKGEFKTCPGRQFDMDAFRREL